MSATERSVALVVERLVEQHARARARKSARARPSRSAVEQPLALGDVEHHGADAEDVAAGPAHRRARDVPVPAGAAELQVVDRRAAVEHAPADVLELPEVLAVGAHRVVDAHEAQVVVDEREPDRRGREHRVEQRQRALGDVVQPRVVDRQRAAAGERLREARGRPCRSGGPRGSRAASATRGCGRARTAARACTTSARAACSSSNRRPPRCGDTVTSLARIDCRTRRPAATPTRPRRRAARGGCPSSIASTSGSAWPLGHLDLAASPSPRM